MKWEYDDGGRAAAGYRGDTRDCVVRSIAIATGLPYKKVYSDLAKCEQADGRAKTCRNGIVRGTWRQYLRGLGWEWTPCMGIGTGCRVHLADGELPSGRVIAQVTKHVCAVIDGVIHDTYDPSRNGTRCVYGYYTIG